MTSWARTFGASTAMRMGYTPRAQPVVRSIKTSSACFQTSYLQRKAFSPFLHKNLRMLLFTDLTIVVFAEKLSIFAKCLPKDSPILRRAQSLNTQFVFPAGDYESVSIHFSNLKLSIPKTTDEEIASFMKEEQAVVRSEINRFKHAL